MPQIDKANLRQTRHLKRGIRKGRGRAVSGNACALLTEGSRFNLWHENLQLGLGQSSVWNFGKPLPITVGNTELNEPMVWHNKRQLLCSLVQVARKRAGGIIQMNGRKRKVRQGPAVQIELKTFPTSNRKVGRGHSQFAVDLQKLNTF